MTAKILDFARPVNGVIVEQKRVDGFINATAMCVAHGKDISDWLALDSTYKLIAALANLLGVNPNSGISPNSLKTRVSATYPTLVIVKRGSPEFGGGTWMHHKLAVHLAQWCNPEFALLVSDWIEEWLTTGKNPIQVDVDQEFIAWQQRHDIRVFLKDFLRPELMDAVVKYAITNKQSPIKLASSVHNLMNKRIQGVTSKEIKVLHGLPIESLIRDYFDAPPLITYVAINRLAKNAIIHKGVNPIDAVNKACDAYLEASYIPTLALLADNLYLKGEEIKQRRQRVRLVLGKQMSLFDSQKAS